MITLQRAMALPSALPVITLQRAMVEFGLENVIANALRKAFYRRAKECHPDKGGTDYEMQAVNACFQVLDKSLSDQAPPSHYAPPAPPDFAPPNWTPPPAAPAPQQANI